MNMSENNLKSNLSTKWNARAGNAFIQWLSSLFCRLCLIQECVLNSLCGRLGCITLSMLRRSSPPFIPPNHQEEIPNPHSNSDQVPVWVQVSNFLFFLFFWSSTSLFHMHFLSPIVIQYRVHFSFITERGGDRKQNRLNFWIFIVLFMFSSDSRGRK